MLIPSLDYLEEGRRRCIRNDLTHLLPKLRSAINEEALRHLSNATPRFRSKVVSATCADCIRQIRYDLDFIIATSANGRPNPPTAFYWCDRGHEWKVYHRHVHHVVVGCAQRLVDKDTAEQQSCAVIV